MGLSDLDSLDPPLAPFGRRAVVLSCVRAGPSGASHIARGLKPTAQTALVGSNRAAGFSLRARSASDAPYFRAFEFGILDFGFARFAWYQRARREGSKPR